MAHVVCPLCVMFTVSLMLTVGVLFHRATRSASWQPRVPSGSRAGTPCATATSLSTRVPLCVWSLSPHTSSSPPQHCTLTTVLHRTPSRRRASPSPVPLCLLRRATLRILTPLSSFAFACNKHTRDTVLALRDAMHRPHPRKPCAWQQPRRQSSTTGCASWRRAAP